MQNTEDLIFELNENRHEKLYEFLATNYDISDLAYKIHAAKYAKISLLNLKKKTAC